MDFDLYSLRIFSQVMADKTFSEAARTLRITQPTVSQQIAKLEAQVGKLFQRVGHSLVPTQLALDFQRMSTQVLEQVGEFGLKNQHTQNSPQGLVRYAMPESCQWTPHYKNIMKQLKDLPQIRFQIQILPNQDIVQMLQEGKLDFGFVVGERLTPELRFQKFSHELYSAVATDRKQFDCLSNGGNPESLRIVTYPGWELFFSTWAKHHGLTARLNSHLKAPIVHIGTLAGAIHAIQQGAGIGVIPTHCVQADLDSGALVEWLPKKQDRAFNPIYLARRIGEPLPKRVETTIELLMQAKIGKTGKGESRKEEK